MDVKKTVSQTHQAFLPRRLKVIWHCDGGSVKTLIGWKGKVDVWMAFVLNKVIKHPAVG